MAEDLVVSGMGIVSMHLTVGWVQLDWKECLYLLNLVGRIGSPREAATSAGYQGA